MAAPRYATRAELRSFSSQRSLNEQNIIRKSATVRPIKGATFLSHSSKDDDLVVGASVVLENAGAVIYTDEVDPDMPPYTTTATANLLKSRIQQAKRFVLLTSPNSKGSRWVPWELGIADGYKERDHVAIFPTGDDINDTEWASWEYLGLYDRIAWGTMQGYTEPLWLVWDRTKNQATPLTKWLAG